MSGGDGRERSQKAGWDVVRWVLMDCRAPVSGSLPLLKLEWMKGFRGKRESAAQMKKKKKMGVLGTNCVSASH